jgi:tRNA1(Val) A37 N6-methylase TrmN6
MSFGPMNTDDAVRETSDDAVLSGRLLLCQPRRGHRVGHDAILLAAAIGAAAGDHAVDLGAGVGAAGLALASRVGGLTVTLVEIDPALAALAAGNARRNGLADRVRALALDVTRLEAFAAAGLVQQSADHVLMNPPFNDLSHASPDAQRQLAHAAAPDTLPRWVAAAGHLLKRDGVLTLIWRADGLAAVLEALTPAFGSIAVLPIYPRPDVAAIRVIVRARKSGTAPLAQCSGLTLNDSRGQPTAAAEAVLRVGRTLDFTEV